MKEKTFKVIVKAPGRDAEVIGLNVLNNDTLQNVINSEFSFEAEPIIDNKLLDIDVDILYVNHIEHHLLPEPNVKIDGTLYCGTVILSEVSNSDLTWCGIKDKNVAKLCDYLNAHSYKPQYEVIYWCSQEDYESNSTKKILYELDSIEESISIATNLVRGFYAAQVRNINTKEILWTSPVDKK